MLEEINEILIYVISPRLTHVLSMVEYPSAEKKSISSQKDVGGRG